eukprot:6192392-Pleurochrysis_carterae.AAC.2
MYNTQIQIVVICRDQSAVIWAPAAGGAEEKWFGHLPNVISKSHLGEWKKWSVPGLRYGYVSDLSSMKYRKGLVTDNYLAGLIRRLACHIQ